MAKAASKTIGPNVSVESGAHLNSASLKRLRVGLVGLGYWGPNLLRNLIELEGVEVAWACDLNMRALDAIKRRFPTVHTTVTLDELLADKELDAVVIATPVRTHFDLASRALAANKHVFVEKPLAASVMEASQLLRAAHEKGLTLMPGHTFLYSPPVVMIKDLIDKGELGDIFFISTSRVNLGLHQPDISVIWDLGPHDFAILRYWLGQNPTTVSAMSRGCILPGVPDVAFVNLLFPSGTLAHMELSWLAPSKLRRTAIVGSRRMIVYDDTSNEPVRIFDTGVMPPDPESFGEFKLTYRTGDIVSPAVDAREPLGLQMQDFCNSIRTGDEPRSSASLGLEVVRIAEAVDAALKQHAEVRLP